MRNWLIAQLESSSNMFISYDKHTTWELFGIWLNTLTIR